MIVFSSLTVKTKKPFSENLITDGDDSGFRGNFSYIDKFNDDTLGVAFGLLQSQSRNNLLNYRFR
jgi:iron complex outermembrane receptor protein